MARRHLAQFGSFLYDAPKKYFDHEILVLIEIAVIMNIDQIHEIPEIGRKLRINWQFACFDIIAFYNQLGWGEADMYFRKELADLKILLIS